MLNLYPLLVFALQKMFIAALLQRNGFVNNAYHQLNDEAEYLRRDKQNLRRIRVSTTEGKARMRWRLMATTLTCTMFLPFKFIMRLYSIVFIE